MRAAAPKFVGMQNVGGKYRLLPDTIVDKTRLRAALAVAVTSIAQVRGGRQSLNSQASIAAMTEWSTNQSLRGGRG